MPSALLKECSYPGCTELVESGPCPGHRKQKEQERFRHRSETLGECDYNGTRWRALRVRFRSLLMQAGVTAACGARLPGAPVTNDSECQAQGVLYGDDEHRARTKRSLHCDHIQPHKGIVALFFDILNLQLLCEQCHNRKSQREGQTTR